MTILRFIGKIFNTVSYKIITFFLLSGVNVNLPLQIVFTLETLSKKYDSYIECSLCPHQCRLAPGRAGICKVRKNTGESIELLTYGVISGLMSDPVEKKPLYHFFPGLDILSVGSFGCNLRCDFCQNWHISQELPERKFHATWPEQLVTEALNTSRNIGIAFTYNEPVIWFEFVRDTAVKIREKGMFSVIVSNGFINQDPLKEMISFTDAFNIDLKAFNDDFYKKLTGARLQPVLDSLKTIAGSGKHLEITTLVIPGRNDSEKEMEAEAEWIAGELGESVPLHLSAYYPNFRRNDPPASVDTLYSLYDAASRYLKYVYTGNISISRGNNTYCSSCSTIVTERKGYNTRLLNLDNEGKCLKCGNPVYRFFTLPNRAGNSIV